MIFVIKNNKIIGVKNCSRDVAKWLIEESLVRTKNAETLSRTIRKRVNDEKESYGYYFQKLDKF